MHTDPIFLGILILCVVAVLLIVLYGIYQENQYRKEILKQFGHSNKDVLLDNPVTQVRDGQEESFNFSVAKSTTTENSKEQFILSELSHTNNQHIDQRLSSIPRDNPALSTANYQKKAADLSEEITLIDSNLHDSKVKEKFSTPDSFTLTNTESLVENTQKPVLHSKNNQTKFGIISKIKAVFPTQIMKNKSFISMYDLENIDLPWFNKKFDYLAFVILDEAKELNVLPNMSGNHSCTVVAYNYSEEKFELAEPMPHVKYQAYVIGLQAINRLGLATKNDLNLFGKNIQGFAKSIQGNYKLTDIDEFYKIAERMDKICASVDQIIALHLVSSSSIAGVDLRTTLENNGFVLSYDGAFYYPNDSEKLFKIVNMEETSFTQGLLQTSSFKGFSILFDIPHVVVTHNNFETFMELAVQLAHELNLDLVNSNSEQLPTESLRQIGDYVLAQQKAMEEVGIIPGGELAKRLFA